MKSIVVGYSDAGGRSEPQVICGPEVSDADQAKVFGEAKRKGRFPKGVARMEWAFVDQARTVVAIRTQGEEGRSPKAEGRKKAEGRNPKAEGESQVVEQEASGPAAEQQ